LRSVTWRRDGPVLRCHYGVRGEYRGDALSAPHDARLPKLKTTAPV
jgi:hypothetical protein